MKNKQYFFYFGPFNFTRVVCKQHFQDDQIKILNDIFEKLGNFEDSVNRKITDSTFALNSRDFLYLNYVSVTNDIFIVEIKKNVH